MLPSAWCFLSKVISGKIEEITVPEQVRCPLKNFSSSLFSSKSWLFLLKGGRYHIGADGIHAPQREDVGDVLARKEVLETWRQNVPEQVLENCFWPKRKLILQRLSKFWAKNSLDSKIAQFSGVIFTLHHSPTKLSTWNSSTRWVKLLKVYNPTSLPTLKILASTSIFIFFVNIFNMTFIITANVN